MGPAQSEHDSWSRKIWRRYADGPTGTACGNRSRIYILSVGRRFLRFWSNHSGYGRASDDLVHFLSNKHMFNPLKYFMIPLAVSCLLSCASGNRNETDLDADTLSPGPITEMDKSRYNLNETDEMLHDSQDSVAADTLAE